MGETGRDERDERRETRHNNSPPTKKLRLRLGWGRGGVWVKVGLGWGSAIEPKPDHEPVTKPIP